MKNALKLFAYLKHYKKMLAVVVFSVIMAAFLNVSTFSMLFPVLEVFFSSNTRQSGSLFDNAVETPDAIDKDNIIEQEKQSFRAWIRSVPAFKPFVKIYDSSKAKIHEWREKFYGMVAEGRRMELLYYLAIISVFLAILRFIFTFLSEYLAAVVGFSIIKQIRHDLYKHILHQDMAFFQRETTGHLMSRITGDVSGVRQMIMMVFSDVMQAPLNFIFFSILLLITSWKLTLLISGTILITIIPIRVFGKKIKKHTRRARERVADLSGTMQEVLSNIITVKAFRMEDYERKKFDRLNEKYIKAELKAKRVRVIASPAMDFLGAATVAGIILLGGYFVTKANVLSGTAFIFYIGTLTRLYKPLKTISKLYNKIQEGFAYSDRLFEIFSIYPEIVDKPDAITLPTLKNSIDIEKMSFGYLENKPVLQDISISVPAGSMLAVVGETGSGKSTFVKLLLRFYEPTAGGVLFDGVDIRDATLASLRDQIGIVLQENVLFNDTVENNITAGKPNVPRGEVVRAAKIANAHDFIEKLPDGYDTIVGERGSTLSGGQCQRIAIARAVLKNPALLILDEATSAMDSKTEQLVQEALERAVKDRTTIVIAHRLSTVMHADHIIVLSNDDGRIIEQGTHNELVKLNGVYANLCARQFLSQNDESEDND